MQTTDRELPGLQPCHANGLVPENLLYTTPNSWFVMKMLVSTTLDHPRPAVLPADRFASSSAEGSVTL